MPASIRVVVSDAELRGYIVDCVNAMDDVHLTNGPGGPPDLVVTDSQAGGFGNVRRLQLVDDPPHNNADFLLMPFDAHTLARAIRRALALR